VAAPAASAMAGRPALAVTSGQTGWVQRLWRVRLVVVVGVAAAAKVASTAKARAIATFCLVLAMATTWLA
jgi:steroid 5-alpha reductase family enzyme